MIVPFTTYLYEHHYETKNINQKIDKIKSKKDDNKKRKQQSFMKFTTTSDAVPFSFQLHASLLLPHGL